MNTIFVVYVSVEYVSVIFCLFFFSTSTSHCLASSTKDKNQTITYCQNNRINLENTRKPLDSLDYMSNHIVINILVMHTNAIYHTDNKNTSTHAFEQECVSLCSSTNLLNINANLIPRFRIRIGGVMVRYSPRVW